MSARIFGKGASVTVAPFVLWLLLLCLSASHARATECPAAAISERVTVVHVYDGDTVKLSDGRRVRLIGINTPELDPQRQRIEPFASEAKTLLQKLVNASNRILLLQYGHEQRDHYGRLLAHAFMQNGDNIAYRLLQAGMATTLVVPPNTWARACYQRVENRARLERRGIWEHPRYQSTPASELPLSTRGFSIVYGTVQHTDQRSGTVWLTLEGPLTLRIDKRDRINFPEGRLEQLTGQVVEARGWIRSRPPGLVMTVRHPAALATVSGPTP